METQDISNQILNEIEKEKIAAFASDEVLFNAVKKYVLAVSMKHGAFKKGEPFDGTINYALNLAAPAINSSGMPRSDEELGQNLRALTYAVSLVESGFRELRDLKEVEALSETNKNPAE